MGAVPIIDISSSYGDGAAAHAVAAEIGRACETVGFLMVSGHSGPQSLIDDADGLSRAFFDLPYDEKTCIAVDLSKGRRGYRRMGETSVAGSRGEVAPHDLREQLVAGPVPIPGHAYYAQPGAARFFPPNVWPERPAGLEGTWRAYYLAATNLATHLMRLFALALHLPEFYFDDKVDRHITQLVSVNYPAQPTPPLPGQLRAGAHSDFGSLTLLATDGTPGGLQVMMAEGEWQDVLPVKGAFIVNLGDLMAQWTNDRWRSTLHRVVNPPAEVAGSSRRHSLVFFHQPNFDAPIECLPTCLAPDERPKYAPVTSGDHLAQKLSQTYLVPAPDLVPTPDPVAEPVTSSEKAHA
jgi:isopenicillin N synthase-like dioxygenase